MSLDGKVAFVSGGTRGIGLACARGLARLGATVVVAGRQPEAAAAALVAEGLDVVGVAVDLIDDVATRALTETLGALGSPDLVICSAGVMSQPMAKTLRADRSEWDRVLDVNVHGVVSVLAAFGPAMVARRTGRMVVLSACLGRMSGPGNTGGLAPYRVSKAAVNAIVRNLAHETGLGARGVSVDAVCPGHCRTDMGGPQAPRSAEDGADTAVWLCSREDTTPTGLLWEDRVVVPW